MQDGWCYVPPGTGELPIGRALELLQGRDYTGHVMFEHEKRWHGELEEPEQISQCFWSGFAGSDFSPPHLAPGGTPTGGVHVTGNAPVA